MSVTWRFLNYKADANTCYNEIQSIGDTVTPQQVVDYAKDENTELHKCFTWDDTEAANKWRKQEARILLGSFVFTRDEDAKEPTKIRAISFSDKSDAYRPTKLIVENKDEYESILNRAKRELQSVTDKYTRLKELDEIRKLIEEI